MAFETNPFTVLSYVSGPALLTNATALMLLSTSNRFARAVDRSRNLVAYLEGPEGTRSRADAARELTLVQKRIALIAGALSRFYLATSVFALATMISIAGAALGGYLGAIAFDAVIVVAVVCGLAGFTALVSGAVALIFESRLATRALALEARGAMAAIERALRPPS